MAFSAARSLRGAKDSGLPLPYISELSELYRRHGRPRFGSLSGIAGMPGSQKSGFAMWLCTQWNLPTLYFSADSSQHTISTRLASIYTDLTSDEVSAILEDDDNPSQAGIIGALESSPISFVYDPEPSLDDIDDEIDAFVECHDAYPSVIVIDNLMDVEAISDQGFASNRALLLEFKTLARRTGAYVLVLHHNKEGTDPSYPAASKALSDKVSQSFENLWSIALEPTEEGVPNPFRVAVVKNRGGRADPSGKSYIELEAIPSKTKFRSRQVVFENKWGEDDYDPGG